MPPFPFVPQEPYGHANSGVFSAVGVACSWGLDLSLHGNNKRGGLLCRSVSVEKFLIKRAYYEGTDMSAELEDFIPPQKAR